MSESARDEAATAAAPAPARGSSIGAALVGAALLALALPTIARHPEAWQGDLQGYLAAAARIGRGEDPYALDGRRGLVPAAAAAAAFLGVLLADRAFHRELFGEFLARALAQDERGAQAASTLALARDLFDRGVLPVEPLAAWGFLVVAILGGAA